MTNTGIDPQTHDLKLAALYFDLDKAKQRIKGAAHAIMSLAGFRLRYLGDQRRSSSQTWTQAFTTSGDHWEYRRVNLDQGILALSEREDREASIALAKYEQEQAVAEATEDAIEEAESEYTGWSRFFLVTSSPGHIHSSMRCSTCRPTTQYGWLPELSGRTEEEAMKACGPTLCTVCFPEAPVDWGEAKISKKDAERMAWSPDRDEKAAKREADREAKAAAKIKKAASKLKYDESLAHKVNVLFDLDVPDVYRWTWDHKGYDNAYYVYSEMLRRTS